MLIRLLSTASPPILAEVSEAYMTAANAVPSGGNQRLGGTFAWVPGKQFNSHTLNANGILIGTSGDYICGSRAGYTVNFAQQAAVVFYINTTATPPQIVGTGSGSNPWQPWPWTVGGYHTLTANQTLGIGSVQTSGSNKTPSTGTDGSKLWACKSTSQGLVIATPAANYSSGTGQQVCANHTTVVNNTPAYFSVAAGGITIQETGKYYICSWGDSTTNAAVNSGMGFRIGAAYTTLISAAISSTGRMGTFSDGQMVGPINTTLGIDITAGSVVSLAHQFAATRTIQTGVGFSGIAIMRVG